MVAKKKAKKARVTNGNGAHVAVSADGDVLPPEDVPVPAKHLVKKDGVKMNLDVELSEAEKGEMAARAAKLQGKLTELRTDLEEEKKKRKAKIKPVESEMQGCVTAFLTGRQTRTVEVTRVFDTATNDTWVEYGGKEYDRKAMDAYQIAQAKARGVFGDHPGLDTPRPRLAVLPLSAEVLEIQRDEMNKKKKRDHTATRARSGKDAAANQGEFDDDMS